MLKYTNVFRLTHCSIITLKHSKFTHYSSGFATLGMVTK